MLSDAVVDDAHWADQHWQRIKSAYSRAPFFREFGLAVES